MQRKVAPQQAVCLTHLLTDLQGVEKKHISFTEGTWFYVLKPLLVLLLNQELLGVPSTEYWVLTLLSGPLQICKTVLQG